MSVEPKCPTEYNFNKDKCSCAKKRPRKIKKKLVLVEKEPITTPKLVEGFNA